VEKTPVSSFWQRGHQHKNLLLAAAVLVGLALRLLILVETRGLDTVILDEQQYRQIATNILAGHGFAWGPGDPTSIRPPLYPALLAGTWRVAGSINLQAVRVIQIGLSLCTAALIYALGRRLYDDSIGQLAAAITWLYPSLIFFDYLLLTEVLFTFLLVAFVLTAVVLVQTGRVWSAGLCGVSLGLAALTRSILWPLPFLLCPLLALLIATSWRRRVSLSVIVLAGYALIVGPWAIRNTRLQGVVTIVDTMGGINLRTGNYEYTPDDRMWDAVSQTTGEKSWIRGLTTEPPGLPMTEGRKDKWAQRKAIEYIRAHPLITFRRSLIKFADFWGLEREFIAGVQQGLFAVPFWFRVCASLAIILGYMLLVTTGVAGIWLVPPSDRRGHILLLLPMVLIVGLHTIVFGHSRYHVPLMPVLAVYAAALVTKRGGLAWVSFRSGWEQRHLPASVVGAAVSVTALLAIWVRQVAFVDLNRIGALIQHVG
jgi:4-amino-4-deoxy-L-arabinose transferase-like glycosyltransferase